MCALDLTSYSNTTTGKRNKLYTDNLQSAFPQLHDILKSSNIPNA